MRPRTRTAGPRAGGSTFKSDLFASLVVFMVALPLCIAIAQACGLPAEAGIITGVVGGLVVGPLVRQPAPGERPGRRADRSGPRFRRTDRLVEPVPRASRRGRSGGGRLPGRADPAGHGRRCRLGQWFRAVSPAVVLGMLGRDRRGHHGQAGPRAGGRPPGGVRGRQPARHPRGRQEGVRRPRPGPAPHGRRPSSACSRSPSWSAWKPLVPEAAAARPGGAGRRRGRHPGRRGRSACRHRPRPGASRTCSPPSPGSRPDTLSALARRAASVDDGRGGRR